MTATEIKTKLDEILNLLSSDKIDISFAKLFDLVKQLNTQNIEDDLILLKANFIQISRAKIQGIDNDENHYSINRLRSSLLQLIRMIEKDFLSDFKQLNNNFKIEFTVLPGYVFKEKKDGKFVGQSIFLTSEIKDDELPKNSIDEVVKFIPGIMVKAVNFGDPVCLKGYNIQFLYDKDMIFEKNKFLKKYPKNMNLGLSFNTALYTSEKLFLKGQELTDILDVPDFMCLASFCGVQNIYLEDVLGNNYFAEFSQIDFINKYFNINFGKSIIYSIYDGYEKVKDIRLSDL